MYTEKLSQAFFPASFDFYFWQQKSSFDQHKKEKFRSRKEKYKFYVPNEK